MTHPIGSNELDPNVPISQPISQPIINNPFPDLDALEQALKRRSSIATDHYPEATAIETPHDPPMAPKKVGKTNSQILLLLFLSVFVDLIGFGVIIPLMPLIAKTFGASPFEVALLFALYSLMQLIFTPFWGYVSDRIGRRPILLMSYLGSSLSYLFFAFAPTLALIFVARAMAGITGSSITVTKAYIADMTTPENRAKGMGIIGAAFGCGFMVGPALGGLLAGSRENPNFQLPLLVAAGLALAAFTFALVALPESLPPHLLQQGWGQRKWQQLLGKWPQRQPQPKLNNQQVKQFQQGVTRPKPKRTFNLRIIRQVLKPIQIRRLISISFLFSLASVGVQTILVLWCEQQFNWGPRPLGILFMFYGIIAVVIQGGSIGVLTRHFREQTLLLMGIILQGLGLFLTPFSSTITLLVLGTSIWIMGESVCRPALNSLISRLAADDKQGITLGVAQSFASGANILGPIIAGGLFTILGGEWSFWAGAGMMVMATVLGLQFRRA